MRYMCKMAQNFKYIQKRKLFLFFGLLLVHRSVMRWLELNQRW